MNNLQLIKMFEIIEKDLLDSIDRTIFYSEVDKKPELVKEFLTKYIDLKQKCYAEIKNLKECLKNKTVIVTGGSSGIGKQVVLLFKKLGATVYVCDLKDPEIEGVEWIDVDVTNREQVFLAMQDIERIDYLITSAGLFGFDSDLTKQQKDRMFNVNVNGTKNFIDACFNKFKKSESGICCVTSGLCKTLDPTCLTYCITKQEIMKLVNSNRNKGVNINTVLPGPILTPLLLKDVPTLIGLAEYCNLNPEGYCGCPEHIALGIIEMIINKDINRDLAIDGGESSMYKKQDNKYWIEGYNGPFDIEFQGKKYCWDLDSSYNELTRKL